MKMHVMGTKREQRAAAGLELGMYPDARYNRSAPFLLL